MLKKTLKYFGSIYLFWMLFFTVGRVLFLFYNRHGNSLEAGASLAVIFHSLRLDTSAAFYLLLPLYFYWVVTLFRTPKNFLFVHKLYFSILLPVLLLITIADWEIYRLWGAKLSPNALDYLKYPAELLASSLSSPLLYLFSMFFSLLFIFYILSKSIIKINVSVEAGKIKISWFVNIFKSIIVLIIFIIALRGGLQLSAINQSFSYFSKNIFLNHAAVNTTWNLLYGFQDSEDQNPYLFYNLEEAQSIVNELYTSKVDSPVNILKNTQPNIILIILESFSTDILSSFGNLENITPALDKYIEQGLSFKNIYTSGTRTDRGLVSIFGGYPSQPIKRIIKKPTKIEFLPALPRRLESAGYNSIFYYGGQSEFANIKAYLLTAGFSKIIDQDNFPLKYRKSKWGVHDNLVFHKAAEDLKNLKEPFFATILTLSSHEPFTVPIKNIYPGDDRISKYKNSAAYTDSSVSYFINSLKAESFYENTLFIFISDHSYHLQQGALSKRFPSRYHIPLILYGPALKTAWQGREILKIGGQTDLAATLLKQIGLNSDKFDFSKDLLDPESKEFAYYAFNDGFGWITPSGNFIYDHSSKAVIQQNFKESDLPAAELVQGKAYLQILYEDYLSR